MAKMSQRLLYPHLLQPQQSLETSIFHECSGQISRNEVGICLTLVLPHQNCQAPLQQDVQAAAHDCDENVVRCCSPSAMLLPQVIVQDEDLAALSELIQGCEQLVDGGRGHPYEGLACAAGLIYVCEDQQRH